MVQFVIYPVSRPIRRFPFPYLGFRAGDDEYFDGEFSYDSWQKDGNRFHELSLLAHGWVYIQLKRRLHVLVSKQLAQGFRIKSFVD